MIMVSGRCTSGYEIVIEDFTCPYFRKTDLLEGNSNCTRNGSTCESTNSVRVSEEEGFQVSCAILVGDYDTDFCLDIMGEVVAEGVPLIGYDCTGRWNQLFYLGKNCTISSVQPSVVGRVRGGKDDVRVCIAAQPKAVEHVTTAACPEGFSDDSMLATKDRDNETATPIAIQYQFLPSDGQTFRLLMD